MFNYDDQSVYMDNIVFKIKLHFETLFYVKQITTWHDILLSTILFSERLIQNQIYALQFTQIAKTYGLISTMSHYLIHLIDV